MLKGIIERHLSQRTPVTASLQICFQRDEQAIATTLTTNINNGIIKISMPWESGVIEDSEPLELTFALPATEFIQVNGQLTYLHFGLDESLRRIVYGIIQFTELPFETWQPISEFCEKNGLTDESGSLVLKDRQYARIETIIMTSITLPDGRVIEGLIEDIGFGGVKIRVPVPISVNTPVTINSFTIEPQFHFKGTCVWLHPINEASRDFSAGICFSQLDPEQFGQVRELIFKLMNSVGESGLKI